MDAGHGVRATEHPQAHDGVTTGRRAFLRTGLTAAFGWPLLGAVGTDPWADPFLKSRPGTPTQSVGPGTTPLELARGRDALLHLPRTWDADTPHPLLVLLHGGRGSAQGMFQFEYVANQFGVCILVPESRHPTWDRIRDDFGPDVRFIDEALAWTFYRCTIDPGRIALGGFSDGASYTLSLGVSNGNLFSHLIAMSPGHIDADPNRIVGRPEVFVSHGNEDRVLPVQLSRSNIVPQLRSDGYAVEYLEFDGGHDPRRSVTDAAMEWFLRGVAPSGEAA